MDILTIYTALVSFFFMILGLIWSNKNMLNAFIKIYWFVLGFWGAFLTLERLGYIIKA